MSETQARLRELVDALRSGQYKQGKMFLKHQTLNFFKTMYCPLGVACELYRQRYPDYCNWDNNRGVLNFNITTDDGSILSSHVSVPIVIIDYFGFNVDMAREILRMNDKLGYNFSQIADYIEFHMITQEE